MGVIKQKAKELGVSEVELLTNIVEGTQTWDEAALRIPCSSNALKERMRILGLTRVEKKIVKVVPIQRTAS